MCKHEMKKIKEDLKANIELWKCQKCGKEEVW